MIPWCHVPPSTCSRLLHLLRGSRPLVRRRSKPAIARKKEKLSIGTAGTLSKKRKHDFLGSFEGGISRSWWLVTFERAMWTHVKQGKLCQKRKQGKQTIKTNNENNGIKIQKQRQWRHHEEQQKTCGAILISGQAAFLAILIRSEREDVAAWAQQDPQYCKCILTLLPEDNMSSL